MKQSAAPASGASGTNLPALVILNPAAGRGRARSLRAELRAELGRMGVVYEWAETTEPGHAAAIAERATDREFSRIILVGGDGTIADLAPALVSRSDAPPLALVPGGTGNDTAKTLGVYGTRVAESLRVAFEGKTRLLDAGRVNGRVFVNGFGAGLDGEVAERSLAIPYVRGILPYLVGFALTLPSWKPFGFRAEIDGDPVEGLATLVAFANGKVCGGGFKLTPLADPCDGLLDACIIGPFSRLPILVKLPKALFGRHLGEKETLYRNAKKIRISFDRPMTGHVDGNLILELKEAEIEVLPSALRAIAAS